MLNRYRRRFVMVNMMSIGLVLALALSMFGFVMYRNDNEGTRKVMRHLLMQVDPGDAALTAPALIKDDKTPPPKKPAEKPERTVSSESDGIVTVSIDRQTGEVTYPSWETDMLDENEAQQIVRSLLAQTADFGKLKSHKMLYYKENSPTRLKAALCPFSYLMRKNAENILRLLLVFLLTMAAFLPLSILLSRRASRPMERALEMERQFVADISHDLKTPITVILANNSILRADPNAAVSEQMQWIDSTDTAAKGMMTMVQQMLTLSALESPVREIEKTAVDLSSTAEKSVLQMEGVAYDRGVTLRSDIAPNLHISATTEYAERICMTLLENALKYEPDNGEVSLTLTADRKKAVLRVQNRGSVIDAEDLPHIFERFYRGDKARGAQSGHGLGLPIMQQMVQLLGAQVDAESSSEVGTVFTVRFDLVN